MEKTFSAILPHDSLTALWNSCEWQGLISSSCKYTTLNPDFAPGTGLGSSSHPPVLSLLRIQWKRQTLNDNYLNLSYLVSRVSRPTEHK